MNIKATLSLISGLMAAGLLWGGLALAEGASKQPNPAVALKTALANLAKTESYRTKVTIEGGISEKEDHAITERTVSETYEGDVFGSLMHVPVVKAYRYPRKGVAFIDGAWRNILADRRTTLLDRLFAFPEIILNRALVHAPKSGRWLTPEEEKAAGYEAAPAADEESDEAGQPPDKPAPDKPQLKKPGTKAQSGKTVAQKPRSAAPEGPAPRVMRIEAPPKEALQHFLEVQNSGCMSGG